MLLICIAQQRPATILKIARCILVPKSSLFLSVKRSFNCFLYLCGGFLVILVRLCSFFVDGFQTVEPEQLRKGWISFLCNSLKYFCCWPYTGVTEREIPPCRNLQVRTREEKEIITLCFFVHTLLCQDYYK